MNIRKFIPKIGFAITLLSLSLSLEGFYRILNYGLVGIIALAAIILLFGNISSRKTWGSIVSWAKGLDIAYIAFGLGLILASSKFSDNGWAVILLLFSGVLFAGAGIGKLIGTGISDVIKTNAKVGIVSGFVCLIIGVVIFILNWNSIVNDPLNNLSTPILITLLSIIFVFFGFKKLH